MKVLTIMAIGIAVIAFLYGLWWLLRLFLRAAGVSDFNASDASGVILIILSFLFILAMAITYDNDDRASCGPGTKEVVERIWTGKVYVTDYVCVVDMDAVQR